MLSLRIAQASSRNALAAARRLTPVVQKRTFIPEQINGAAQYEKRFPTPVALTDAEDPLQNGGYVQPARVKRQHRDPHGDWWDKQERRNLGEPIHEDYDQLGMFTPYDYTWTTTGRGLAQIGAFIVTLFGVMAVVKALYPDRPAVRREFADGLERELGGRGGIRARSPEDGEAELAAAEEA